MNVEVFHKNRVRKPGATLLEVIFALVILLFMTTVLSGMFFYTARMENKNQALGDASHESATRLESIKKGIVTNQDFHLLQTKLL